MAFGSAQNSMETGFNTGFDPGAPETPGTKHTAPPKFKHKKKAPSIQGLKNAAGPKPAFGAGNASPLGI